MGQKITEHPSVDYWVRYMRERDKFPADAIPKSARYMRPATDKKEASQYEEMLRARTKMVHALPGVNAEERLLDTSNYCVRCGILLSVELRATKRPKRSVWLQGHVQPIHYYTCGNCA
jgi:hypothetical protein